ncbi:hypothetical protein B0E53_00222 [Micromonospora sp. MH33]|uniref:hypothetical protein n=1 Tax=Micromonospora sp. MH33 TaxID=1945509 RepID=UPI000D275C35|nr:hypothetical protein [Micromonospora sp. MH33]PSK67751.1 hypothetical protein B0E53_00222 [Micromonospora sp. MH33]
MSDAARWTGPGRPEDVVELRVHGASGASAGEVLDTLQTEQVAGDRSGGFYRTRRRSSGDGARVTREAYRWGDLPSGTMARTLLLVFLLPFMLVNVAIWMRPANRGSDAAVRSLCRLLALTLTALYVLAVAGVALDLIAWKCLASPRCLAGRGWLSWLGGRPAGLRLAVLALVPAAAVAVTLAVVAGAVLATCAVLLCTPPLIDRQATDRRLDRITGALRSVLIPRV